MILGSVDVQGERIVQGRNQKQGPLGAMLEAVSNI